MAVSLFLKASGVSGESKNSAHAETTELQSVSWGATNPSSFDSGGGLSAGEATFMELTATSTMDKAFSTYMGKLANGNHLDEVKVTGSKMGGSQIDYFEITLTKALVTSLQVSAGAGSELMVAYSFSAAKFKVEYWVQNDDGSQGSSSPVEFDIKANK